MYSSKEPLPSIIRKLMPGSVSSCSPVVQSSEWIHPVLLQRFCKLPYSLQSLDWNGGMQRWTAIVECVLQGERSLLMQFSIKAA